MKKFWIALIAAALLIPLGMWWFSPAQAVMRRTKHLMEVLSISEGASRPFRQAKVFSMNAMLAPQVELTIPGVSEANGSFDKQEMGWLLGICFCCQEFAFRGSSHRDGPEAGKRKLRF